MWTDGAAEENNVSSQNAAARRAVGDDETTCVAHIQIGIRRDVPLVNTDLPRGVEFSEALVQGGPWENSVATGAHDAVEAAMQVDQ